MVQWFGLSTLGGASPWPWCSIFLLLSILSEIGWTISPLITGKSLKGVNDFN